MTQNVEQQAGLVAAAEVIDPDPTAPEDYEVGLKSLNQWQLAWRKFRNHKLAIIGLGLIFVADPDRDRSAPSCCRSASPTSPSRTRSWPRAAARASPTRWARPAASSATS